MIYIGKWPLLKATQATDHTRDCSRHCSENEKFTKNVWYRDKYLSTYESTLYNQQIIEARPTPAYAFLEQAPAPGSHNSYIISL